MNDDPAIDDPQCKALAKHLVVLADKLHRAIFDAAPEQGQALVAALELGGAQPHVTVRRLDPGNYEIVAGHVDQATGKGETTYRLKLSRTDAPVLPLLKAIAQQAGDG